jgi:hypothetical protein
MAFAWLELGSLLFQRQAELISIKNSKESKINLNIISIVNPIVGIKIFS